MDRKTQRYLANLPPLVPQCVCTWGKVNIRCPYLDTFENMLAQIPTISLSQNDRDKEQSGDNGGN